MDLLIISIKPEGKHKCIKNTKTNIRIEICPEAFDAMEHIQWIYIKIHFNHDKLFPNYTVGLVLAQIFMRAI